MLRDNRDACARRWNEPELLVRLMGIGSGHFAGLLVRWQEAALDVLDSALPGRGRPHEALSLAITRLKRPNSPGRSAELPWTESHWRRGQHGLLGRLRRAFGLGVDADSFGDVLSERGG